MHAPAYSSLAQNVQAEVIRCDSYQTAGGKSGFQVKKK